MTAPSTDTVSQWHEIVEASDPQDRDRRLDDLIADDCVFRSPAVHTPQEGKSLTTDYLRAAMAVLGPTLRYVREIVGADSACLEFRAQVDGREVHGVDLLRWDPDGRLVEFTVMVRPVKGFEALIGAMAAQLSTGQTAPARGNDVR